MSYDEMMMAPDYTFTGRDGIPDHVTHVLIAKALKFVRARAFFEHPNIQEVICHDGVEKIERDAFFCCPSLRRVIMPGVKIIEHSAFFMCEALEYVKCGKLEIIRFDAFRCCQSLRSINLPSARIIGKEAFGNCKALEDVKFGCMLEKIGERAFRCYSLETITIPLKDDLITSDGIFQACKNLHQVDLVEAVELNEFVASLQLEEWRNDMNAVINSINQILPDASAGNYDYREGEVDPGEKARVIRQWISELRRKIIHYRAKHQRILDESATLPPHTFEEEEEGDKENNSTTSVTHSDIPPQAIEERVYAKYDDAAAAEYNLETGAIAARESANIIHENELLNIGFMPDIDEEEGDEDEEESEKEDNNSTTPDIHSDIPPQAIEEHIDAKIDNAAAAEYNLETGAIAARESANIIHENKLLNIGFMPDIDEEEEEEAEQGIIARDERTPIIPVESTSFTSPVGASPSVDPPSSNAPVVAKTKVEEKRVEESTLFEADEEDIPQISPLWKVFNGIFMLMKWASILPLALGVIYILPVFYAALVQASEED